MLWLGLTLWRDGAGLGSARYVAKPDAESPKYAAVAQQVEHGSEEPGVVRSIRSRGTT